VWGTNVSLWLLSAYTLLMSRISRANAIVLLVLALGVPGLLASPATAIAKSVGIAPPGNSALSQYVEDIPTVKGNKPTIGVVIPGGGGSGPSVPGRSGSSVTSRSVLSASVIRKLSHAGGDGKASLAIAEATSPPPSGTGPKAATRERPASTAAQLVKTLGGSTGGGGFGALLPVFLITVLVAASAVRFFRHRRTS
jgi:hypothetical protein